MLSYRRGSEDNNTINDDSDYFCAHNEASATNVSVGMDFCKDVTDKKNEKKKGNML